MTRSCQFCHGTLMFETIGEGGSEEYSFFCSRCQHPFVHITRTEMIDLVYHEIMKKMGGG